MTYELDPELAPAMAAIAAKAAEAPRPPRGDWRAVRATAAAGQAYMATLVPPTEGVSMTDFSTQTLDGEDEIKLRWYTTAGPVKGSAVVYTHGGGMLGGTVDLYDTLLRWYVAQTGVPFLSVGLRLAPEAPTSTAMAEDVFTALEWLHAHANELGVDPSRIAVMGDSGGGGPTAGAAILARDQGVPVAKQVLVYPMLDDRNTTPGAIPHELVTWDYDNNYTGWVTLLGDEIGTDTVSPISATARLENFAGLPPAYIDVGDLDIFRNESIAYATGIPVELHVHPGAPHGFERLAPDAAVSRRAMADRARAVATL